MKIIVLKIILIISMLIGIIVKSQNIVAIGGNNGVLPADFQSSGQYYYKDVYNYLDSFVGTWEYVNGNEKFQIVLTKVIKYHEVAYSPPYMDFNYYTDGITFRYKKFVNGNLIFESPITNKPTFESRDGLELEGNITDYGRVTQTVNKPQMFGGGIFHQGGEHFYPRCSIEKLPLSLSQPPRIKFHLYFGEQSIIFGNPYDNPIYAGQPFFSIPNDIIMTKVP